ncbi:MAG: Gfo/Idh/MocA family oxidoreductase [Anaerolineales bacterium]|nr:Gfo/Idh/MocA family oxidoreductase [Anaerolineales bacterium]
MQTVRWGLLSTANINRRLIPAIRASKRGELAAVASRDQARAKAYAAEWHIPRVFGDYQAMLDSGQIDAVYISLPNHLHAEWSIRAMQAGVHVLCEKPFAITLDEVERMIAASQESGRVLAEAFMYRHHPQTRIAGEWAHSGRLGEISLVRGVFNFAIKSRENVRLAPEYGGGCLWDVGVYPLSFAQYIYGGPPLAVSGMQWLGEGGVDESFAGQMRYPGDRLAQISSSFRTPFYTHAEVIGAEGRLVIDRPFIEMDDGRKHMFFYPKEGKPQSIPVPKKELYLGEVEDMHAAILDGAAPYLGLGETRNHVRTALALYESARSGQVVEL